MTDHKDDWEFMEECSVCKKKMTMMKPICPVCAYDKIIEFKKDERAETIKAVLKTIDDKINALKTVMHKTMEAGHTIDDFTDEQIVKIETLDELRKEICKI
jgi:hypothetical protein